MMPDAPHMSHMTKTATPIRIASYNIRKTIGLDRKRNPGRILDVINGLDADVIALQEVDRRLGARPSTLSVAEISSRTDLVPVNIAANDVSLGWHGNAVLVRKGTTITKTERVDLPGLEPRGAIMVELHHDAAAYRIVATHLGLTRTMRRAQMSVIAANVAARSEMATFIVGDFNEWSSKIGLEPLKPHYAVHSPGRSFHAARPVAALDRIAANKAVQLYDAGVQETGLARRASDHLPIWGDFHRV